jgi:hypothetical protein
VGRGVLSSAVGVVAALALSTPATAVGATTINFEQPAAGTVITNQYADAGGTRKGVVFGPLPGGAGDGLRPVLQSAPGQARSGSQVANIATCNGCEFFTPNTTATFSLPRSQVSVYVGYLGPPNLVCTPTEPNAPCAFVTLTAYDAGGNQVGSSTALVREGKGVNTPLSVSTASATIRGFKVAARSTLDDGKQIAIDDLTFDTSSAPPPPAFDVRVAGSTNVSLSSCTAIVPVEVTRDPSFLAPVFLAVTGLPPGVSAQFQPKEATFPNGALTATVRLILSTPNSGTTLLRRTATIHATSPPLAERTTTFAVGGTCPAEFDPQITSMQITQGTQLPYLPPRSDSPIPYSQIEQAAQAGTRQAAAHFEAGRWTVVRVYADLRFGPPNGFTVPAVLAGFKIVGPGHRVPLPGSPILPTFSPSRLRPGPGQASLADEGSDTAAYEFTVPSSWTHGNIELDARLLPTQPVQPTPVAAQAVKRALPGGLGAPPLYAPCTTGACAVNDTMGITDIPFREVGSVEIRPLALTVKGDNAFPDPNTAFGWARNLTPLHLLVEPYATTIDVSDLAGKTPADAISTMNDRVGNYVCNNDPPPGYPVAGWIIGVSRNILHVRSNVVATWCWGFFSSGTYRYAVVDSSFPAYSVPHELFHLFGLGHASGACGGANDDTVLNLGLAINNHESWPLDQVGYLQSVGLSPQNTSNIAPYHVIFGAPPTPAQSGCTSGDPCPSQAQDYFDFMSYCGNKNFPDDPLIGNVWVSTHNWNAVFDTYSLGSNAARANMTRVATPRARAPGASTSSMYVTASVGDNGAVTITSVHPVTAPLQTPPADSDYALSGLDAAGRTRATIPMFESFDHADGGTLQRRLEGVVPAAGLAALEIVKAGQLVASRHESAHAPTIRLAGLPKFSATRAVVRWSAHDADNDPLDAEISYSGDDGHSWKLVWIGPNRGRVTVPAHYFPSARRARIRVAVNDGFRTSIAVSRRFRSPGEAPLVSILLPARRFHQPNDAPLLLSGQAFDDHSRVLAGGRLRWMLGRRRLGTGAQITATGLPPGVHRIDLVARDSTGRVGRASVIVRLDAARPLFLKLTTPRSVRRSARSLRFTVSSSLAATLIVQAPGLRAQRFSVGRRTRRLTVRIHSGGKALSLRLVLTAARKRNVQVRLVGRRR